MSMQVRGGARKTRVFIIFHLQLINSGHAGSSIADKKRGKLSS